MGFGVSSRVSGDVSIENKETGLLDLELCLTIATGHKMRLMDSYFWRVFLVPRSVIVGVKVR